MIPYSQPGQDPAQQPPSQQPPSYSTPPTAPKPKSNKALLPILLTVGFIMLAGVAWLTYDSISKTRALEVKVAEFEEAEKLRGELESQYNQAIAELNKMKGENEQINAMIEQQKLELEANKGQISTLLADKKQLDAARREIAGIKAKVTQYIAEIEQLKTDQDQLTQQNTSLKEENAALNTTLQARAVEHTELSTAKAQLVSEKEELSKAVEVGSVIKVKDIKVNSYKVKKNGKTRERENAKRVDQLKICFTTVSNDVVNPGTEQFFIRIISPKGETLAIDDLGSGTTVDSKTGQEVKFTQAQHYEYANDETQLCFAWQPNVPFQQGKYFVEIYNKGYLAGKGEFELK